MWLVESRYLGSVSFFRSSSDVYALRVFVPAASIGDVPYFSLGTRVAVPTDVSIWVHSRSIAKAPYLRSALYSMCNAYVITLLPSLIFDLWAFIFFSLICFCWLIHCGSIYGWWYIYAKFASRFSRNLQPLWLLRFIFGWVVSRRTMCEHWQRKVFDVSPLYPPTILQSTYVKLEFTRTSHDGYICSRFMQCYCHSLYAFSVFSCLFKWIWLTADDCYVCRFH